MSTILHRLAAWSDADPDAVAQVYRHHQKWKPITAKEYCDRVYWLALFLESKGMVQKDIGTIFSYNCPAWVHMDLATMLLGAKSAGLYPNSTRKDIHYILNHTESRFLAVQNKEHFEKMTGERGETHLPERIELILVFDGDESISTKAVSYSDALKIGKKIAAQKGTKKLSYYLSQLDPHSGAFMIYTSGTTGAPKGVILSHDNLVYTIDKGVQHWNLSMGKGTLFSFLPLCHIAEKLQNVGAGVSLRYSVSFCSKFENVSVELPEIQPSLLLCVPRLWEKMKEGVMKKLDGSQGAKKKLALWAFQVGARVAEARFSHEAVSYLDQIQWKVADLLVLSKIRKALGLGQAQTLVSGAAALSSHVCKWFRSLGLDIMEDFGQTESSGVVCMTIQGVDCAGTVGKPVAGMEVRIAADGEILTRGRHVFKGYFKDDAATAQALDAEGWLHTGDLGEEDGRGLIRIKGRKKEILKTSGGKMVAPLPIEEALKASPLISQVCMVGDGRKYLAALITLSESKLDELSRSNGALQGRMITVPQVVSEIKKYVEDLNATLPSYEQIKKFAILSKEFSVVEGEMTPTLKMKRNIIESRYQDIIEQFYES